MKSSITQLVVGYSFKPRLGVQANIPLISREYRRIEDGVPVRGDVGGIGYVSFLGRFSPLSRTVGSVLVHVELFAGLKTPTGDGGPLSEGLVGHDDDHDDHDGDDPDGHHDDHDGDDHRAVRLAGATRGSSAPQLRSAGHAMEEHESSVHGHDLALGSGSVDGLFGASAHASWKRLFVDAALQYAVRGNGDFSYEYANALTWETSPGVYLVARDAWTAALGFVVSGENKGRDHQKGMLVDDSAITAVYVGPELGLTWTDALHAGFAADLPVMQKVTGTQIVADYRLRAGLTWRF